MHHGTGNALRNTLKPFFLICLLALVGLAVLLWSFPPKDAKSPTDITIQSDLQPRLRSFSPANESSLRVIVGHGTVRLEGTVIDQYEHDAVLEIAKQGSGTNKIEDALKITLPQSKTQKGSYRHQAWLSERWPQNDLPAQAIDN